MSASCSGNCPCVTGSFPYGKGGCRLTMGTQLPEWKMEKQRFYVELPGDMYSDGHFMNRIKGNQIIKGRDSRMPHEDMLQEHQVTTELQVIDPNDS